MSLSRVCCFILRRCPARCGQSAAVRKSNPSDLILYQSPPAHVQLYICHACNSQGVENISIMVLVVLVWKAVTRPIHNESTQSNIRIKKCADTLRLGGESPLSNQDRLESSPRGTRFSLLELGVQLIEYKQYTII